MGDTGDPQSGLVGNSLVLYSPYRIQTDDNIVLFDRDGWHLPMLPTLADSGTLPLGTVTRKWEDLYLSGIANVNDDAVVLHRRMRVSLADMNAGKEILAAVAGLKYRLVDVKQISIGGAMAATADATGTAVYGTQSTTEVALYTVLLAAGAENVVCQINTANTSVLNAGASFAPNDAGTGITCKAVSAGAFDLITATAFDILLSYTLEA